MGVIQLNCLEMFSSLWLFSENSPPGSLRMLPVVSVMTGVGIYSIVVRGLLAVLNTTDDTNCHTKFGSQVVDSVIHGTIQAIYLSLR